MAKRATGNLVQVEKTVTNTKGTTFTRNYWVNPDKVSAKAKSFTVPKLSLSKQTIDAGGPSEMNEWLTSDSVQQAFVNLGREFTQNFSSGGMEPYWGTQGVDTVRGDLLEKQKLGHRETLLAGSYNHEKREVSLTANVVSNIRQAIADGQVTTPEQSHAMATLSHELAHASIVQGGGVDYEPFDAVQRPFAAIDEAMTEIVGRTYAQDVAKAVGAPYSPSYAPIGYDKSEKSHLFRYTEGDVDVRVPAAYRDNVCQFGRLVAYAVDLQGAREEDLSQAIVSHAREFKAKYTNALVYTKLAAQVTDRHLVETGLVDRDSVDYREAYDLIRVKFKSFMDTALSGRRMSTKELDSEVKYQVTTAIKTYKRRQKVSEEIYDRREEHPSFEGLAKDILDGKVGIAAGHTQFKDTVARLKKAYGGE